MFNPLKATESIKEKYINFFQTSFAPNNDELKQKFVELKERGLLWREPYISISQRFQKGRPFDKFIEITHLDQLIKTAFKIDSLYLHQEKSISNILGSKNTIVASGTGSGKTEIFFIPVLDYCLKTSEKGIKAVIIYPMNALANDQVDRLRKALFEIYKQSGRKITFGIYTGQTPENTRIEDFKEMASIAATCPSCGKEELVADSDGKNSYFKCRREPDLRIDFQPLTREEIRNNPPDILITNYVQLEYLLLRKKDERLFDDKRIHFLILDEIHSYAGARGIDVALLVRRFRRRILSDLPIVHVGTSATLSKSEKADQRKMEIALFAETLFGSSFTKEDIFEGEREEWRFDSSEVPSELLQPNMAEDLDNPENLTAICKILSPLFSAESYKGKESVSELLLRNAVFQEILKILEKPVGMDNIVSSLLTNEKIGRLLQRNANAPEIVWEYLKLGSKVPNPSVGDGSPLLRVNIHNFFKSIEPLYICAKCGEIYATPKDVCDKCASVIEKLGVCRFCGKEFMISNVNKKELESVLSEEKRLKTASLIGKDVKKPQLTRLPYSKERAPGTIEVWQSSQQSADFKRMWKCMRCGSLKPDNEKECGIVIGGNTCESKLFKEIFLLGKIDDGEIKPAPHYCPHCGNSYGRFPAVSPVVFSPNTASTTFFDLVFSELPEKYRKMLIFTDNRQAASYIASYLEDEHLSHTIRILIHHVLTKQLESRTKYSELKEEVMLRIQEWYGGDLEEYQLDSRRVERMIDEELTSMVGKQRSLENLGLIEINYNYLEKKEKFNEFLERFGEKEKAPIKLDNEDTNDTFRKYLISLLNIMRTDGAFTELTTRDWRDKEYLVGYIFQKGSGPTKPPKGINIKNLNAGKPVQFTSKVFKVNENEAETILEFAFDLLRHSNLIVEKDLRKFKDHHAKALVVNASYIIVKKPAVVQKCGRCKKVFTNLPGNQCISWRCNGVASPIEYNEFEDNNKEYYFRKYESTTPIRMVTREDTGALDPHKRREIEVQFKSNNQKERKIDVVVATPTLELGVDIGDLVSVGLFKSPPAPVNYIQRVGRAGRKEGIAFNNTFLFQTPIDAYYFRSPYELILGEVRPPFINLQNWHMIRRHINAVIIEDLLVHSGRYHVYPTEMLKFVEQETETTLLEDIRTRRDIMISKIRTTLQDVAFKISDEQVDELIEGFRQDVKDSIRRFSQDRERYHARAEKLRDLKRSAQDSKENRRYSARLTDVEDQLWKLEHETKVLDFVMKTGVLPRYAFPGIYVDLEDEFGVENFSGRSRNTAITEFAPNMEIFAMKKIFKSVGIDYKFVKPDKQAFFICESCNKYVSKTNFSICHLCKRKTNTKEVFAIAPEVIYLRDTKKRINEPREYQEPIVDLYISTEVEKGSRRFDNIVLTKYGNVSVYQILQSISTEEYSDPIPIELCSKCGRAKDVSESSKHRELGGKKEFCTGKFEPLGIYHEMPTNVISIKVDGNVLFGIELSKIVPNMEIFLTTLKSAIISAGQIVSQAEDGEIDGVVKDNEILLFDNVEGGVGYVDFIYEKFDEVFSKATEIVLGESEVFGEDCTMGCMKCLWSYRRKRDIPLIDKRTIVPFLKASRVKLSRDDVLQQEERIQTYIGKDIRTIHSPASSFLGVLDLKNILRSAKKEIKLTSLYVTDDKISWPDEGDKSWVDILSSIRQGQNNVSINVIVKEPTSSSHKKALRRLKESGVTVKVYKKEVEQMLPGIIHSKLVVIDHADKSNRHAIHTSGNFSPEMWKNHDTYDFGTSEAWVQGTYDEITKLERESRDLTDWDTMIANGIHTIALKPGQETSELGQIGVEIGKASKEICIMDPYLSKIEKFFEYLEQWLRKGAKIRIVTARAEGKSLLKTKEKYTRMGYNVSIIRYFDREKKTGKETILHDRYVIIDGRNVIDLGKGVNILLDSDSCQVKDNVVLKILEIPSEVEKYVDNFKEFWEYRNSSNEVIRSFPKEEY